MCNDITGAGHLADTGELGGLCGDLVKHVVHEGVEDAHGLGGDASVGVNLMQQNIRFRLGFRRQTSQRVE